MDETPTLHEVVYSEREQQHLLALSATATERGDGEAFLAALKEFQRLLCVYPQFGDPLIDQTSEPGQIWIGILRPLSMRYGLYESRRLVLVVALPVLLPMSVE